MSIFDNVIVKLQRKNKNSYQDSENLIFTYIYNVLSF